MAIQGRLQYDKHSGVIYFFDDKSGACVLRIEGVPEVPDGYQLDIHLVYPGNEHHHENCGNRALVKTGATPDPGVVCAVKILQDRPTRV